MDEEMEEAAKESSFCFEVDLDYEFDAPQYFDLGCEEPQAESWDAERWFDTAGSYPPSPLIVKVCFEDRVKLENSIGIPVPDFVGHTKPNGCMPDLCIPEDSLKCTAKSTTKGPFSKGSTLMKPTASQLAKQTKRHEIKTAGMCNKPAAVNKPIAMKSDKCIEEIKDCTFQAAKRQRLERGHLCKAVGRAQPDLIHKVREKITGHTGCNNELPKLKITIPREPVLETKRRAERLRIQRLGSDDVKQLQEAIKPSNSACKHTLSRTIHETPHVLPKKTTPKLLNSRSDVQPTVIKGAVTSFKRTSHKNSHCLQQPADTVKTEECRENIFRFKARPLDKKILSSRGDVGVFRSTKQQTTVPKEFNLSTSKRSQQIPLTELFNKLSLAHAERRAIATQAASSLPIHVTAKDSKENINNHLHC